MKLAVLPSLGCLVFLSLTPAAAQHDDEAERLEVIQLRNSRAVELADVALNVLAGEDIQIVVDPRSNSLVVRTTPTVLTMLEKLITQLDVRIEAPSETSTATKTNTYTWPLQHRRVQEILPSLEQLMAPYPIVADPARNLIIFNGTPEDRQKVEQLVNVFDVPSASLSLELVVLGPGGTHAADVDAPIAKQLSELGLSGYGTQSRSLVRALENGPFSLTEVSVAAERKLHFKGEIRLNENGRLATLDFSLSLEQAKADRIQLDTTIRIPVADRVLLGLTTTGSGKEPLVLVARVTRDDLGR